MLTYGRYEDFCSALLEKRLVRRTCPRGEYGFFRVTIGNPLNWRNATNMKWHQRSLTSMTLSNGTAVSFQYNADGIRTKKTDGSSADKSDIVKAIFSVYDNNSKLAGVALYTSYSKII